MLFSDCVILNGSIYGFSQNRNMLIRLNEADKSLEPVGSIPDEPTKKRRLVAKVLAYESKLIMVPSDAPGIWIYDVDTDAWDGIATDDPEQIIKFGNAFIHDGKVIMPGCLYDGVAVLDLKTKEVICNKDLYSGWKESGGTEIFYRDGVHVDDDTIALASCRTNEIAFLDLNKMIFDIKKIGHGKDRFESVEFEDGKLWITPRNGDTLYVWDMKSDPVEKKIESEKTEKDCCHYCGVAKQGETIRFFASGHAKSFVMDHDLNILESSDHEYMFCHKEDDYWIAQRKDGTVIVYRDSTMREIDTSEYESNWLYDAETGQVMSESPDFALEGFVRSICR